MTMTMGSDQPTAPAAPLDPKEIVGPVILVDESLPQVIALLEKYSGKMVLRTQTLPVLKVNFNGTDVLTREQAVLALESLLTINGVSIVPQGEGFLKATPVATANLESPPLYMDSTLELPPSERIVARLFTLNNTTVQVIEPALQAMVNKTRGGSVIVMPTANAVLFTDAIASVQKAEKIVEKLDAPNSVIFIKVNNIRASDVMKQLKTLQAGGLKNVLSGDIAIEADDLANQVMLVASPQSEAKLRAIVEKMDLESLPKTESQVLGLKHSDVNTVMNVLSQIATGQDAKKSTSSQTSNTNTSGGISTGVSTSVNTYATYSFTTRSTSSTTTTRTGTNQPQAVTSTSTPTSFSDYLTVSGDERTNRLMVFGTSSDLEQINELVAKIDVPLPQVRIEAIIVEVTLSGDEASGLDTLGLGYKTTAASGSTILDGDYEFNTSTPNLPNSSAAPFSITGSLKDFSLSMVFNKAESNSRIRILSAPLISTPHNQPASIFVGQTRPVVTSTSSSSTDLSVTSSEVEQKEIGLSLNVLPRVGADGAVEMKVDQTSETITGSVEVDGNEQPITATRSASSYLIANHNETVVLAGLQSYKETDTNGIVWLLGYIPIIGQLFQPETKESERTEIIIFLKPHIIDQTKPSVSSETPGLQPGSLTRIDAESYLRTGRFSAVSLTPEEHEALDRIRRRQEEYAQENRARVSREQNSSNADDAETNTASAAQ